MSTTTMPDSAKTYTHGAFHDDDGNMVVHMHPKAEIAAVCATCDGIGGQVEGAPCVWCSKGVPLYGAVRRVIADGFATIFDAESGAVIGEPTLADPEFDHDGKYRQQLGRLAASMPKR